LGLVAPGRPLRERVGAAGEAAARAQLEAQGMRVLETDWRCRLGQIDLVAIDGDVLVIVEVKARRGTRFGLPQEAVDWRKQNKLRLLVAAYQATSGRSAQPVRVDVVAVLVDSRLRVTSCDHIRDAVGDR
jgi:putative endonuclease